MTPVAAEHSGFQIFKQFVHCIIPFGKFKPPYLGKSTTASHEGQRSLIYPVLQVHAGSFRVPVVIHRTLTWTAGSLTCLVTWSFLCHAYRLIIHTGGWVVHRQSVNTFFFTWKSLTNFVCAPGWVRIGQSDKNKRKSEGLPSGTAKVNPCQGRLQGWRGGSVVRALDLRSKDLRFEPRQEHKHNLWVFPSQKCCADSLSVCPTPPHVSVRITTYARAHVKDLVVNVRVSMIAETWEKNPACTLLSEG